MQTLQLPLEDDIFQDLRQQATLQATSVENLARKALVNYLHLKPFYKDSLSTQIYLGDLAVQLFGKENGVELELVKHPFHNPLKLD
jgi:chaperone required for assembly of F1-ATPase